MGVLPIFCQGSSGFSEGLIKTSAPAGSVVTETKDDDSSSNLLTLGSSGEIATASNSQAQGIEQVNRAVAEMDNVVQNATASAEESASASEELNAQAEQMKGIVQDLVSIIDGRAGKGAIS